MMQSRDSFGIGSLAAGLAVAALLAFATFSFGRASYAGDEVGKATLVVEDVLGQQTLETRQLAATDPVHDRERIKTGADSAAGLLLIDGTELALGPDAEIALDEFVYDKASEIGRMVLNVAAGTMRFATGAMPKPSYEIRTPSAVVAVRGTIFTLHVTPAGATFIAVEEGATRVRSARGESYDVPAGSTLRLDPAGRAALSRFRPSRGVDFADLFDGGFATRQVRRMDDLLDAGIALYPDAVRLTPRVLGLVELEEIDARSLRDGRMDRGGGKTTTDFDKKKDAKSNNSTGPSNW